MIAKILNILLAVCDVVPVGYSSKPLGLLSALWDADRLLCSPKEIQEAEALRRDIQSDFKVMFARRGIPVKP